MQNPPKTKHCLSINKLAKLKRHASRVHFAKIHVGKIHFGKKNFFRNLIEIFKFGRNFEIWSEF